MSAHTPEPWVLSDDCEPERIGGHGVYPPAYVPREGPRFVLGTDAAGHTYTPYIADYRRIVACVNACAGMVDPASDLARLRGIEAAARVWFDSVEQGFASEVRPDVARRDLMRALTTPTRSTPE